MGGHGKFRRFWVILVGLALCATVTFVGGPTEEAAAQSDVDTTMLLFDLSGSMGAVEPDGRTRLAAAQDAMISAIGGLAPGSKNIGIRTFSDCGVSTLAVPPGPVDQAALSATISSFQVVGFTDISFALQQAAGDLAGQSGRLSIILLSDGQQTCPGDPCATAQGLIAMGIDVIIHAIGIGTAGTTAEQQLACIAGATGGTVVSVDNADELFEAIDTTISGGATAAIVEFASPICITSALVQDDDSLGAARVGSEYTDAYGVVRLIVTGDRCGYFCHNGWDANCDDVLGDFCPSEFDINTVFGAGKCLETLRDDEEEVDENGDLTLRAVLSKYCDGALAPDMVVPCGHYAVGQDFKAREDDARAAGDARYARWNKKLADDAFKKAETALADAIARYVALGRTYKAALSRVVTGRDASGVDLPALERFADWRRLAAYPLLSGGDRRTDVSRTTDVAFLNDARTSTGRIVPALLQIGPPAARDVVALAALQVRDPEWDCDASDFQESQWGTSTRVRWTAPDRGDVFQSTLFRVDGAVPIEIGQVVWREPFARFDDLVPGADYAMAVTAEDSRGAWEGTCITFLGAHSGPRDFDLQPTPGIGRSLEEDYLRALSEDLSYDEFTQILLDNFPEVSGNDRKIQERELVDAFGNRDLSDEARAAALRGLTLFRSLDVAKEVNLRESLTRLDTSFFGRNVGDGDVSRDDLREFPDKFFKLVMLAPWLTTLDEAGAGGLGGIPEISGSISDDDVDAFLATAGIDNLIKYLVAEVFDRLDGDRQLLLPGTGTVLLERPPTTIARPGIPRIGPPAPTTSLLQPARVLPRVGTRAAGTFGIGVYIGWKVGSELRERVDAEAPEYITIVNPVDGSVRQFELAAITRFPEALQPEVIRILIATGEIPEPEDLQSAPPDTFRDGNGQLRDAWTGELVNQTTGEPLSDEAATRRARSKAAAARAGQTGQGPPNIASPLPNEINLRGADGEINFEAAAAQWAAAVNSNRVWRWFDLFDEVPTDTQKARIRQRARSEGLVLVVPTKPGGDAPDFESVGQVYALHVLPPELWRDTDSRQFTWLDSQLPNGRPPGMTWHHSDVPGHMELVPLGLHNATFHVGPRGVGGWAEGSR